MGSPVDVALDGKCTRMRAPVGGVVRYLDAYTDHNGNVVTRSYQSNDTQLWCFTRVRDEIVSGLAGNGPVTSYQGTWYTIQHRSFTGQYLDASVWSSDPPAVLRDAQSDHTQEWLVVNANGPIRQGAATFYRWLHPLPTSQDNYRVVASGNWNALTSWNLGTYQQAAP